MLRGFFNVDCIESERYALAKVGTSIDRKRGFQRLRPLMSNDTK